MALGRALADQQRRGDLAVGPPLDQQPQHLALPRGQPAGRRRSVTAATGGPARRPPPAPRRRPPRAAAPPRRPGRGEAASPRCARAAATRRSWPAGGPGRGGCRRPRRAAAAPSSRGPAGRPPATAPARPRLEQMAIANGPPSSRRERQLPRGQRRRPRVVALRGASCPSCRGPRPCPTVPGRGEAGQRLLEALSRAGRVAPVSASNPRPSGQGDAVRSPSARHQPSASSNTRPGLGVLARVGWHRPARVDEAHAAMRRASAIAGRRARSATRASSASAVARRRSRPAGGQLTGAATSALARAPRASLAAAPAPAPASRAPRSGGRGRTRTQAAPRPAAAPASGSSPVRPGQRRPQVVVLGLQPVEPRRLLRPEQLRLGRLGQRQEVRGVPPPRPPPPRRSPPAAPAAYSRTVSSIR